MTRRLSIAFAVLTLLSVPVLSAESFRIAGIAVDALGGKPVRGARIVVSPSDAPTVETASAITPDTGRFEFVVPKGKWHLYAERRGLWPQSFGAESIDIGFGIAVVTGNGYKTDNLLFRLFPPSGISGRVTDETGEPVEGALIQLVRSLVIGGRRVVRTLGWVRTNDLGEYRLAPIGAGRYYLAVTGTPWYAEREVARSNAPALTTTAYAPVYFPNTADAGAAAPIVVQPGQEATADFTLRAQPGYDLKVHIDGERPQRLTLHVVADGIQGVETFQRTVRLYYPETTVSGLPSGRYQVRIVSEQPQTPAYGIAHVEIGSANAEVTVVTAVPATVTGSVRFEFADAAPPARAMVGLLDEATGRYAGRPLNSDRSFSIPGVIPGKYRLFAGAKGAYTKVAESGGKPIIDRLLEVGATAPEPLKIVLAPTQARVKGIVNRAGSPAPGVLVVLAPTPETGYGSQPQGFQTDSDGSYDFDNLRPGDYDLIVADDSEIAYAEPEALRPYAKSAKRVHLDAETSLDLNLEMP